MIVGDRLSAVSAIDCAKKIDPQARLAPFPLAGRGWGWGSPDSVRRRLPQPSPARQGNRIWRLNAGSALPPPLAGEGWGGGIVRKKLQLRPGRPPPAAQARRPPPQAGEANGESATQMRQPSPARGEGAHRRCRGSFILSSIRSTPHVITQKHRTSASACARRRSLSTLAACGELRNWPARVLRTCDMLSTVSAST